MDRVPLPHWQSPARCSRSKFTSYPPKDARGYPGVEFIMPKNLRANIELGVQIVIAVAVVVAAGVLVKRNLFSHPANPASMPRINAGEKLNVPNVDWEQNKKSLVFFLKKDCVFCTSSAPFYRQLLEEASKRNVKSLAILPDSDREAREYVKTL